MVLNFIDTSKLQNDFTTPEQSKRLLELGLPADSADSVTLQQMFIEYMEDESEWHTSGPCECCGDLIFEYNKEL